MAEPLCLPGMRLRYTRAQPQAQVGTDRGALDDLETRRIAQRLESRQDGERSRLRSEQNRRRVDQQLVGEPTVDQRARERGSCLDVDFVHLNLGEPDERLPKIEPDAWLLIAALRASAGSELHMRSASLERRASHGVCARV